MTTDEFLSDSDLQRSWSGELSKDITKLALEAMDESSPACGDFPETAKESSEFRFGFIRGYTFYHKKLQELGRLKPVTESTLRRNWGETANAGHGNNH